MSPDATPPPLRNARRRTSRQRRQRKPRNRKVMAGYGIFLLIALGPIVFWYGFRIEPDKGEIAVMIRKTGTQLPSGQIIATQEGQQGIQIDVLSEGRYFRNPYNWDWEIHHIIDVPAGKLGVLTRQYGEDLPPGRIIATEGSKGILREVLMPGKHRINPYAYHIEQFDAITVRAGHVGVITSLVGTDVLNSASEPGHTNTFLVGEGVKGVVQTVVDPGTYYLNPYEVSLVSVNLQGQRFEMSDKDVVSFLTEDGFTVTVEGTIEYAITRPEAAYLTHRVGDMEDIVKKIILPRARGFSRIEGSKHPAINFIVGQTRQAFQNNLEDHLRKRCADWGVEIRSVLVRKILPPDDIASINRDREVARQEAAKYEQQIEQARSKAELTKQEMLAIQNKEKVEGDTARIRAVILADQKKEVQLIAANKDLEVAKVRLEAAKFEAEAILLKADGEKDAVEAANIAEARVLTAQAEALGDGTNLAKLKFYERIAPALESILSNDGQNGIGGILRAYLPEAKEVQP